MPSISDCPSCGKPSWNLKPYLDKETAKMLFGSSDFLIEGKYCPYCGKLSPSAPPPEAYKKRIEEEKNGK